ncbi:phosphomannomutase [bacterium A37T11]|nr:phosphomannomutase [bacterium A37T11]
MTLIKSISGIRGTIGGKPGDALTPFDIIKYTAAFGWYIRQTSGTRKIVIGRDARISGDMVRNLVAGTLQSIGIDVVDLGLSTTPTVEIAVPAELAGGGIIITASHNPFQWNALKLLNAQGEFINDLAGKEVLQMAETLPFDFAEIEQIGQISYDDTYLQKHIDKILKTELVDTEAIKNANFRIAIDAVNSTGGIFVPALLKALGVNIVYELNCEPNGRFAHNPEPLPENLKNLAALVQEKKANLGIAVDPDVDRLCFVMEDGQMFGEEYTLVAVADYVLQNQQGNSVSNLSSTRALHDVTMQHGGNYFAAAVGEVNVVTKMKEVKAIIGGEGNGGIIYPESHYGRDALIGIALFLTYLAKSGVPISTLRAGYPEYHMSKNKVDLNPNMNIDQLLIDVESLYQETPHSTIDGLKIDFEDSWVHLRKSNTEPIIRIYAEAPTPEAAKAVAQKIMDEVNKLAQN